MKNLEADELPVSHHCNAKAREFVSHKVHVENGGKPLCRNRGDSLELVPKDEFEKTNPAGRCGTCEQLTGLRPGAREIDTLSEKQKALLREIYEKINGADKWYLTMLLSRDSNNPADTSLYRSLRRLQKRGLIAKMLTEQKRAEVRLVSRVHILDGKIIVRQREGAAQGDGR